MDGYFFFTVPSQCYFTISHLEVFSLEMLNLGDLISFFGPTRKVHGEIYMMKKNMDFLGLFIFLSHIYLWNGIWVFSDLYCSRLILSSFIPIFDIIDYLSPLPIILFLFFLLPILFITWKVVLVNSHVISHAPCYVGLPSCSINYLKKV